MAKFVNDEGTFEAGFEQHLPEDLRDYAKGFKNLPDALKSGLEARRDFRDRVKIPTDPADRKKFMQEHFGKDLEAEAAEKKKADDAAAEKLKGEQAEAAKATAVKQAEAAEKFLKDKHGTNFDTNLELVRRAFRGDHVPDWIKAGVAKTAGVDLDKLTDDQFKAVVKTDPAVFETLLSIGKLSQSGRTEHGDGHSNTTTEQYPAYPYSPEVYGTAPKDNPERLWFANRGAQWDENGKYLGGYGAPVR
jgi:Sec-independent protein translocase protein TatA